MLTQHLQTKHATVKTLTKEQTGHRPAEMNYKKETVNDDDHSILMHANQ